MDRVSTEYIGRQSRYVTERTHARDPRTRSLIANDSLSGPGLAEMAGRWTTAVRPEMSHIHMQPLCTLDQTSRARLNTCAGRSRRAVSRSLLRRTLL